MLNSLTLASSAVLENVIDVVDAESATGLYLFLAAARSSVIRQGTFGVAEYRAYTVGRDGHINGFEPLVCANDAEAIEKVERLVERCDVELWSGTRLVVRRKRRSQATAWRSCGR
jgi:hypothetical protein